MASVSGELLQRHAVVSLAVTYATVCSPLAETVSTLLALLEPSDRAASFMTEPERFKGLVRPSP